MDETAKDDAVLFDQPIEEKDKQEETYEVLPSNWLAMTIFVQVQTQWRIDQGVLIGFDYKALEWIFKLNKKQIKKPLEILADLQVLEAKIVETVNDKNK
ncbi:MAG: hypothetical protein CMA50_01815 [Euryarchaeota archaeon]|nr:hypothetical protein [Euryarchaeota archaeon]